MHNFNTRFANREQMQRWQMSTVFIREYNPRDEYCFLRLVHWYPHRDGFHLGNFCQAQLAVTLPVWSPAGTPLAGGTRAVCDGFMQLARQTNCRAGAGRGHVPRLNKRNTDRKEKEEWMLCDFILAQSTSVTMAAVLDVVSQ